MKINIIFIVLSLILFEAYAQESFTGRKFEQMETMLPTPNTYRSASGAPGHEYWQQKADYVIDVELNDENHTISGYEVITYTNNSPDPLSYLWLQLEQNMRNVDSDTYSTGNSHINQNISENRLKDLVGHNFDLGFNILEIKDLEGNDLSYFINKTMMSPDIKRF